MVEVAKLVASVTAETAQFESGIARAGNTWSGFVRDVTGGASSLASSLTHGLTMGAGFAGGLVGVQSLGAMFGAAQDAVIGFNSQLQKSAITFTAFAGSVELSQQFIGQLKELAATSPFEFQDVLKGAQRFAGMGLAMENIIPIMKDVSVVAQAMGAGATQINEINLAISQVVARGKVSAQEMNQLANAGIPAWQIMAQAMNKTVGEVMKLAEAGQVSAADFLNAFDKAAHDPKMLALGEAMNKSFDTAMSNVHDRLQFFAADAGKPIFDMATNIANGLANILGTPVIQGVAQGVSAMVEAAVRALDPLGAAFNAAFATLQTGDLTGALRGLLGDINAFAGQMFGAGYTLVTTMASGMLSGLGAVVSAAADIAATIAGFFIGQSPPPDGPLAEIERGGQALMQSYVGGMAGGLGELNTVTQGVADAFGNVNKEMTLDQGRAGLQAAAGNAAMLKTEASNAEGVIRNLDGMLHEVERSSQALKFAADDIKQSYQDQIDPLQAAADAILKQNDFLDKQVDLADRLRDAELKRAEQQASGDPVQRAKLQAQIDANNERLKDMRLAQSEADLEKQIAEARKDKKDTSGLQARLAELQIQKQNAELEKQQAGLVDKTALAQIKQQEAVQKEQEDRHRTEQEIQKLQREQAAAPLLALAQSLKAEEEARLKPIEAAAAGFERQRAVLQAQHQDWAALKQDIAAANSEIEKAHKAAGGGAGGAGVGGGLAGLKITPQPIAGVNEAAQKMASDFGTKFKAGVDDWFKGHGGELMGGFAGAVIGGTAFGPLGALVGGMFGQAFVKGLQERFPNVGAIVQEKLGVAAFAVDAFGKILQGQDAYIIPFREALKTIVPPEVAGAITAVTTTIARMIPEAQAAIQGGLPGIAAQLLAWGQEFVAWIAPTIPPMLAQLGALAGQFGNWLLSQVGPLTQQLAAWGKAFIDWVAPQIPGLIAAGNALYGQLIGWIVQQAGPLATQLLTWGQQFIEWVAPQIPGLLAELGRMAGNVWQWIGDNAPELTRRLASWATEFVGWVVVAAIQLPPKLVEFLGVVADWIVTTGYPEFVKLSLKLGAALVQGVADGLGNFATKIGPMLQEGIAKALSFIDPKILQALGIQSGAAWNAGVQQGLDAGRPELITSASGAAGVVPETWRDAWEMHSPSQVAADIGFQFASSLAMGISRGDTAVAESVLAITKNAIKNNIDPLIALALAKAESGFNTRAIGDQGHSGGLFQLHDQGQGAGMSMAQRQDPWVNAGQFLAAHAQLFQQLKAEGLAGEQLAATFGRLAEQSDPRYAQRYADAYRELVAQFGAAGPAVSALTGANRQLTATQQQATDWAKVFADQQAALTQTLEGQAPALRDSRQAMGAFGAVLGPIERQVAGGSISLSTLQFKLVDLARATGLATRPWDDYNAGLIDIDEAMKRVINQASDAGPQFDELRRHQDDAGRSAADNALDFLQLALKFGLIAPAADAASEAGKSIATAMGAAGNALDPLGGDRGALLQQAAVASRDLAAALGEADGGFTKIQASAQDASSSVREFYEATKSLGNYLDDHTFKFHVDLPDLPDWAIPGSPTPFERGLWGIHAALIAVGQVAQPSLRSLDAPTLAVAARAPVSSRGGGTTYVDQRTIITAPITGHVLSEGDLADHLHNLLLEKKRRNGRLGLGDGD